MHAHMHKYIHTSIHTYLYTYITRNHHLYKYTMIGLIYFLYEMESSLKCFCFFPTNIHCLAAQGQGWCNIISIYTLTKQRG